jgi:hypothetical protein
MVPSEIESPMEGTFTGTCSPDPELEEAAVSGAAVGVVVGAFFDGVVEVTPPSCLVILKSGAPTRTDSSILAKVSAKTPETGDRTSTLTYT